MRKTMLLIAALAIVAAPTAASAKHKKSHKAPVAAAPADPNAATWRLLGAGFDLIFVPINSLWVMTPAPVVAKY